jgi:hypothetical protein
MSTILWAWLNLQSNGTLRAPLHSADFYTDTRLCFPAALVIL